MEYSYVSISFYKYKRHGHVLILSTYSLKCSVIKYLDILIFDYDMHIYLKTFLILYFIFFIHFLLFYIYINSSIQDQN